MTKEDILNKGIDKAEIDNNKKNDYYFMGTLIFIVSFLIIICLYAFECTRTKELQRQLDAKDTLINQIITDGSI